METAARLLALLLRARWTGEDGIAAAAVGVAPKALETQLRLHGVAGVLSLRHVEQIQQLPAPLAVAIASTQRRSIPASLKLAGACLTACRALEKAGIPVLPLKGQALSWQIYGAIGVRHSGDIDLLVDPADVPAAIEVMQDTGYQSTLPLPSSPLHWRERMRTVHHLNFRDRDNGGLELHWRTDPLRRTSLPALSRLLPELTLMADGPLRGLRQLPMPRLLHAMRTLEVGLRPDGTDRQRRHPAVAAAAPCGAGSLHPRGPAQHGGAARGPGLASLAGGRRRPASRHG